jgi:glycosyltransferase involved in cell wall biosynthesis
LNTVAGVPESKVRVVYNGINTARFSPAEVRPDCIPGVSLPEGRPVYTVVANLIREKGIDVFLHAAKRLVEQGRPGIFLIVGTGDQVADLRRLTGELNLNDRVFFLGVHSDVERIHRFTDIFIGPSLWQEAFGLANIEAMSCALPVISTRVGAIPEVVEDGLTGILVEPETSKRWRGDAETG